MPTRRENTRPTKIPGIFVGGPGRYLVRARWTDPKSGKRRKREGVAKTFEEAVALQVRIKGEEPTARPTRQRFGDYAERWLANKAPSLQESTRDRYVVEVAHAIAGLGQVYVDALSPRVFREWRDGVSKQYEATTVNSWHRTMRVVFDPLVEDGILTVNPARKVSTLREGRTKGRRATALVLDQFRRVLPVVRELMGAAVSPDVGRMILTVAWTGMRRGELLALKFDDQVEGEIHVQRSVYRRHEKATKTDDPRYVTIVPPLAEVLAEQRRWLIETQHPGLASGLVFPADPKHARAGATRRGVDEMSWYRSPSVLNEPLRRVAAKAGVPEISPHGFRRTWERLLRKAGVDGIVRRAIAGWRTEEAQLVYEEVDREDRDAAAQQIVALVLGGGGR